MEEQIIRTITDRPCSYEFGPTGNRQKVYYNDAEDLNKQIEALKKLGLWPN